MSEMPSIEEATQASTLIGAPVAVPPIVYGQLTALRDAYILEHRAQGIRVLPRFGFETAADWVTSNYDSYWNGHDCGFIPTDPAAVPSISPEPLRKAVSATEEADTICVEATETKEERILDALRNDQGIIPAAAEYAADGTWRDVAPLTASEQDICSEITEPVTHHPKQRHQYVQQAFLIASNRYNQYDVTYVEGYAFVDPMAGPIHHVWIEINGKVAELTLSWDPETHSSAYLGKSYSVDAVRRHRVDSPTADSLSG